MNPNKQRPELLAPAGQVESFLASIENGADAVYFGLKQWSARASAANFSLDDAARLVAYAHKKGVCAYVALNSLVTAREIPAMMDSLQALSDMEADALIVQDAGLFHLARRHFPRLKLHASTLMTVHNQAGVRQLERMGAERVVLARELSLEEIEQISRTTEARLEVFIHGALCFSYSGMCLASSFIGGHSGLQGRCAQPCRLRYRQGRREGFFLSCDDFCALSHVPRLANMRLAALKIEGRMKSADAVANVVKAYRTVLDAPPHQLSQAMEQAREWLAEAPSRRLTPGFLAKDPEAEVLSPHRSGSSGLWVGTVKAVEGNQVSVLLRHRLRPGDRLRPETQAGKEEKAFTVSHVFSMKGEDLETGKAGEPVLIKQKGKLRPGDRLIKVGVKGKSPSQCWQTIRQVVGQGEPFQRSSSVPQPFPDDPPSSSNPRSTTEKLLIKISRAGDLGKAFQSPAHTVLLTATRANLEQLSGKRLTPPHKKRFAWSLPPLLSEREMDYYRAAVQWYVDKGFQHWEINNWGHLDFFQGLGPVALTGGWRLNARNAAAVAELAQWGFRRVGLSLEITLEELEALIRGPLHTPPVVTVYCWPPLFTSRLTPKFQEDKPLLTPRREMFFVRRRSGLTCIYADRPLNWLEKLPKLRSCGYRTFLMDLSEGPHGQMKHFERLLSGFKRARADQPCSLFNFDRSPVPPPKAMQS